jgi:hypothetical protein
MCGCALKGSLATFPARAIIRANPAVVNGVPRFDVNTKGDLGSCSRWSRLRARSSSPRIGCFETQRHECAAPTTLLSRDEYEKTGRV